MEQYREINDMSDGHKELCYCDKVNFKHYRYLYLRTSKIEDIIIKYLNNGTVNGDYKMLDIIYDHLHYHTLTSYLANICRRAFRDKNNKLIKRALNSIVKDGDRDMFTSIFLEACYCFNKEIIQFMLFYYVKYVDVEEELSAGLSYYNSIPYNVIKYMANYGYIFDVDNRPLYARHNMMLFI